MLSSDDEPPEHGERDQRPTAAQLPAITSNGRHGPTTGSHGASPLGQHLPPRNPPGIAPIAQQHPAGGSVPTDVATGHDQMPGARLPKPGGKADYGKVPQQPIKEVRDVYDLRPCCGYSLLT